MGYKAVFLDGTNGLPDVECEVCKRLRRNIIEPVVLFIEENEDVENLSQERIKELLKENKELNNDELRCIFHCEKENEIWIKNLEEYNDYKKRLEKANKKGEDFSENNPAKWNEILVDEFWKRIRSYRYSMENIESILDDKDSVKFPDSFIEWYSNNKNLEPYKNKSVREDYSRAGEFSLNFGYIIFPSFMNAEFDFLGYSDVLEYKKGMSGYCVKEKKDYNFWFKGEQVVFKKDVYFTKSKFLDNNFAFIIFQEQANFSNASFLSYANFQLSEFSKDVLFDETIFLHIVDFSNTQWAAYIRFGGTVFFQNVFFRLIKCKKESNVKLFLEKAKIYKKMEMEFAKDSKLHEFSINDLTFSSSSLLNIKNLKVVNLIINKTHDTKGNLFFYNLKLLKKECVENIFKNVNKFEKEKLSQIYKFLKERDNIFMKINRNAYFLSIYDIEQVIKNVILELHHKGLENNKEEIIKRVFGKLEPKLFYEKKDLLKPDIEKLIKIEIELNQIEIKSQINPFFTKKINGLYDAILPGLRMIFCLLSKTIFINCDFSETNKITIEDSSVSTAEFVNVDWGEITEERICPELFENEPKKAQDVYRQLKLAHDNQKDFIHGNDFYALEMRAYDKYLTEKRNFLKSKKEKNNFHLLKDLIVFKISKIASNFGQDWVRVLKWIYMLVISLTVIDLVDTNKIPSLCYLVVIIFLSWIVFSLILVECDSSKYRFIKYHCFLIKTLVFCLFLYMLGFYSFSLTKIQEISSFLEFFVTKPLQLADFIAVTISKIINPWKTIFAANGLKHIHGYEAFFVFSWIILSYLVYQLIISLRRKIRR